MSEMNLSQQLTFVASQRRQAEAAILAEAMQAGMRAIYRDALIEAYLLGRVPREKALRELGPEQLEEVEYQRDALRRDVVWGLKNE